MVVNHDTISLVRRKSFRKKGEFNMQFSQRILNVQPSATLALSAKAKAM